MSIKKSDKVFPHTVSPKCCASKHQAKCLFFGYTTNSFLQSTTQNPENIYFHERQDHHFTKPIVSIELKHSPKVLTNHVTSHSLYDWPWHRRYMELVRSPLNTMRPSTPQLLGNASFCICHSLSSSDVQSISGHIPYLSVDNSRQSYKFC